MFEISETALQTFDMKETEKQTDLAITLRPKKVEESRQSIVIKGTERQLTSVYAIKMNLLDESKEDRTPVVCNDYEFMQDFSNLSRMSNIFPALFSPHIAAISPLVINSPSALALPSPVLSALPTPAFCDSSMGQMFTFPPYLNSAPPLVNHSSMLLTPALAPSPFFGQHSNPTDQSSSRTVLAIATSSRNASHDQSSSSQSTDDVTGSTTTTTATSSLSSSSATNQDFVGTGSTSLTSATSAAAIDDVIRASDEFKRAEPIAAGLLMAAQKIQEENAAANNCWKAPGAERVIKADYGHQKILATKAMTEKVVGCRIPNDHWSGFGFSRSTPAHVLKARLEEARKGNAAAGHSSGIYRRPSAAAPPQQASIGEEVSDVAQSPKQSSFPNSGDNSFRSPTVFANTDDDKIGPWTMEKKPVSRKTLNATGYFDFVNFSQSGSRGSHVRFSDVDDLATVLTNLQLSKYIDTFREQEIDMKTFLTMTDEDLKELGVNTFGARRKMLVAISEVKELRKSLA